MKLDKIAFAKVVALVARIVQGGQIVGHDIDELDHLIDIPIPEPVKSYALPSEVDALLAAMNQPGKKIEAIKAYRSLTGAGLKESKDAVERYWTNREHYSQPEPDAHTLSDILGHAMKK